MRCHHLGIQATLAWHVGLEIPELKNRICIACMYQLTRSRAWPIVLEALRVNEGINVGSMMEIESMKEIPNPRDGRDFLRDPYLRVKQQQLLVSGEKHPLVPTQTCPQKLPNNGSTFWRACRFFGVGGRNLFSPSWTSWPSALDP